MRRCQLRTGFGILKEAAAFFSNNIIALMINEEPRELEPAEMKLSAIFGPFGLLSNPHLIRDLRRVDLTISIDRMDTGGVALHRVRINHFVNMIKQHAVDNYKRPFLRRLHVRLASKEGLKEHLYPSIAPRLEDGQFEEYMCNLECFAELTHIPIVEFTGLPEWFAQCLTMRVRGEGGDLSTLKWPMETLNRRKGRFVKPWKQSMRRKGQVKLAWDSFAKRNGIEIPEDASRFFPPAEDVAS